MRLAMIAAAVLLLAACKQQAPPADLTGVTNSVDALAARVDAMASRIDTLATDVGVLTQAAIDLQGAVSQPLNVAAALAGFTGVAVHTVPEDVEVSIESGPCPDGTDRGFASVIGNAVGGTTIHSVPAGTHCLRTLATEELASAGATVTIPDGTLVTVSLLPQRQVAGE